MKHVALYIILIFLASMHSEAQNFNARINQAAQLGNNGAAINTFQNLASEARAIGMRDTVAVIQLELAAYYFDHAISFDSAIYYCDQALSSIQENTEAFKIPYLKAWYNKGYYYRKWDKYEQSKEALNIVLNEPENAYTYDATWQLGKLYKDRGEFELAFKQYQKALELAGNDPKKKIQVYEYISFAYLLMETEEGAKSAIYWLDKLEAGVKGLPDDSYDDYLPLANYNKASCYYQLGDLEKAEFLVDESARLLDICCDDPDFMGLILDFRGYMDYERGHYESAIEKYKKGIDLFQYSYDLGRGEGLAGSFYAIAEAYMQWEQLDSARFYIDKAIVDRTYGYDNNLKGSHFPTMEDMMQNGEKAYLINDLLLKGAIFQKLYVKNLCTLNELMEPYEMAEQVLDAMAYDHVEEATKVFWRETAKNIYYQLIRLHIKHGKPMEAFLLSEKAKYVILEEHVRKLNFANHQSTIPTINAYQLLLDSIKDEEVSYENKKLIQFAEQPSMSRLTALRNREDDLLDEIRVEYPGIYDELFTWREPAIQQLQSRLAKENTLLIEYFIHDSMSYAFVVDGRTITAHELCPSANIVEQTKSFLSYFEPDNVGQLSAQDYEVTAMALFDLILDKSALELADEIIIVPDGILTLLPFEVLVYGMSDGSRDYSGLNYLIKYKPIRYIINAKSVYQIRPKADVTNQVVSFAPEFKKQSDVSAIGNMSDAVLRNGLTPLGGALKEIETLCSLFSCRSYTQDVSERLFYNEIAKNNGIIHVATHALMNDSVPSHSKLIMESTGDPEYDDAINLFELKNKRIQSDLVVLSACNTGVGKIFHGEGLASLGIAFNYAGSPNLVTSLWSIPDRSSSIIMQEFYKRLKAGRPKHHALRDAKLSFLNDHPSDVKHPFYWGGLLYYGDGAALSTATMFSTRYLFLIICLSVLLIVALAILISFMSSQKAIKSSFLQST